TGHMLQKLDNLVLGPLGSVVPTGDRVVVVVVLQFQVQPVVRFAVRVQNFLTSLREQVQVDDASLDQRSDQAESVLVAVGALDPALGFEDESRCPQGVSTGDSANVHVFSLFVVLLWFPRYVPRAALSSEG